MWSFCWLKTKGITTNMPRSDKKANRAIRETVALIAGQRPALAPLLTAFEPLIAAREEVAESLASDPGNPGLPAFQPEQAREGLPILADHDLSGIGPLVLTAARRLFPLLLEREAIASYRAPLEKLLLAPEETGEAGREEFARLLLEEDPAALEQFAQKTGIPVPVLGFAASFVLSAVLRALVRKRGESPWDADGAWAKGYCPVCGTWPVIAWLAKPDIDEKNAFLVGGGGKKHFHCGQCGADWKFRRGVCPACGDEDGPELLSEEGRRHERLDFCGKCRTYCATVDLREMARIPDMDVMAMGLAHLDWIAAERDLRPLRPTFWNMSFPAAPGNQ